MAFTYGFYNSYEGDRRYSARDFSALFDDLIVDGVFENVGQAFAVTPGTGLQVIVAPGRAWFNSTWSLNDAPLPVDLDEADISLTRIDAIVLEVNAATATRENSIKVIKGTSSTSPQKPGMLNSDDVHQHPLAYVTINKNAKSILQENIEVVIGRDKATPYVTGILQTVSVENLFQQWNGEFSTWFSNVKAQLAGDIATNLQRQIDEMNENKVNVSDKATKEDIEAGTEGKWVDVKGLSDQHYLTVLDTDDTKPRDKLIEFNPFGPLYYVENAKGTSELQQIACEGHLIFDPSYTRVWLSPNNRCVYSYYSNTLYAYLVTSDGTFKTFSKNLSSPQYNTEVIIYADNDFVVTAPLPSWTTITSTVRTLRFSESTGFSNEKTITINLYGVGAIGGSTGHFPYHSANKAYISGCSTSTVYTGCVDRIIVINKTALSTEVIDVSENVYNDQRNVSCIFTDKYFYKVYNRASTGYYIHVAQYDINGDLKTAIKDVQVSTLDITRPYILRTYYSIANEYVYFIRSHDQIVFRCKQDLSEYGTSGRGYDSDRASRLTIMICGYDIGDIVIMYPDTRNPSYGNIFTPGEIALVHDGDWVQQWYRNAPMVSEVIFTEKEMKSGIWYSIGYNVSNGLSNVGMHKIDPYMITALPLPGNKWSICTPSNLEYAAYAGGPVRKLGITATLS